MDDNVHIGDGVLDEVKTDVNNRLIGLGKIAIDLFFDYLDGKVENLPDKVKQLRNYPEPEKEMAALWSEYLVKEGLLAKGCNGLPDNFVISNLHQEGYLGGLYVGYVLAMMALVNNDAPQDIIFTTRDYIRSNLIGHHYDNRDEIIAQYKDEKYNWVEK